MFSFFHFFFFFQAEDGIRDPLVTGVQTCALPISTYVRLMNSFSILLVAVSGKLFMSRTYVGAHLVPRSVCSLRNAAKASASNLLRSEERRVGKECRSRCASDG